MSNDYTSREPQFIGTLFPKLNGDQMSFHELVTRNRDLAAEAERLKKAVDDAYCAKFSECLAEIDRLRKEIIDLKSKL